MLVLINLSTIANSDWNFCFICLLGTVWDMKEPRRRRIIPTITGMKNLSEKM